MDTTETYIKMCEKAVEIQDEWNPPQEYDIEISHKFKGDIYVHHCVDMWGEEPEPYDNIEMYFAQTIDKSCVIWLPRQDQLQEMVHSDWISTLEKFALWALCPSHIAGEIYYGMGISHNIFTMEQLWLAFVMKEKFNKVWNGEDWVSHLSHKVPHLMKTDGTLVFDKFCASCTASRKEAETRRG